LPHALAASRADLQADVATQLLSIIAGEVLTQAAVRTGVSAGIVGTGAAFGWATFGVGIVVGLILDQVITWVWDWCADRRFTEALSDSSIGRGGMRSSTRRQRDVQRATAELAKDGI